jgi:hypothetical protein
MGIAGWWCIRAWASSRRSGRASQPVTATAGQTCLPGPYDPQDADLAAPIGNGKGDVITHAAAVIGTMARESTASERAASTRRVPCIAPPGCPRIGQPPPVGLARFASSRGTQCSGAN